MSETLHGLPLGEPEQTGILPEEKEKILGIIDLLLPGVKVYLFGSRARGTHREGSDIDLAIDAGKPSDHYVVYEAKEMIEASSVPFRVDLVDLQVVSPEMMRSVRRDCIAWKE